MSGLDYSVSVMNAMYASNNKGISVKSTIIDKVLPAGGDLRFTPSNDFFGQDPDPGHTKYCLVIVMYSWAGGVPSYVAFGAQEGSPMEILPDGQLTLVPQQPVLQARAGRHRILWAVYANRFGGLDTTSCVQALENTNVSSTGVFVGPQTLGYDFSPGQSKYLFICCGDEKNATFKAGVDGATLVVS